LFVDVANFEHALTTLKSLLLQLLANGYRLADKELRNEVLIVLNILCKFPKALPCFIQSEVLNILITYACVVETGKTYWPYYFMPIAKIRNFGTVFEVDIQFKRLLWLTLSEILKKDDPDAILCIAASPLLLVMFTYLEKDSLEHAHSRSHHRSPTHNNSTSFDNISVHHSIETGGGGYGDNSLSLLPKPILPPDYSDIPEFSTRERIMTAEEDSSKVLKSNNLGSFLSSIAPQQLRELQVLAMVFISENAPKFLGEFLRLDGHIRVLVLIHQYYCSNIEEHRKLLYYSLLTLIQCAILAPATVKPMLEYQEVVHVLLNIFQSIDKDSIRSQAARLISIMCTKNEVSQKQLRRLNGISLLINAIAQYAKPRRPSVGKKAGVKIGSTGIDDSQNEGGDDLEEAGLSEKVGGDISIFIISILDCIQEGVVANFKNEARFAEEEGLDTLFDLLEVSPFLLRLKVLRLLSDVLQNNRLVSFAHAWRSSKSMRSAGQLLCHCWLDEECRLNCARLNGVINNIWEPLKNHEWPIDTITQIFPSALDSVSVSVGDMDSIGLNYLSNFQTLNINSNDNKSFADVDANGSVASKLLSSLIDNQHALCGGGVPHMIRVKALEADSRCILANIMYQLGLVQGDIVTFDLPSDQMSSSQSVARSISASINADGTGEFKSNMLIVAENDDAIEMLSFVDNENKATDNDYELHSLVSSDAESSLKVMGPSDIGLAPKDRQVLSLAKRYNAIREGEWWKEVESDLAGVYITPIESDFSKIECHLTKSFDAALTVQMEQLELESIEMHQKQRSEDAFIEKILEQKTQQIKAEWIKRNAKRIKNKTFPHDE
jgi:hypothetical protein